MAASCHGRSRTRRARGTPAATTRWRIGTLATKKAAGGAVAPRASSPNDQIGLGGESRGHFGGSGARPLRCREIIGKGLVNCESAALVSGFEPSRSRQLEGGGPPRIAG